MAPVRTAMSFPSLFLSCLSLIMSCAITPGTLLVIIAPAQTNDKSFLPILFMVVSPLVHCRFDHPVQLLEIIAVLFIAVVAKADVARCVNDVKFGDRLCLIRLLNCAISEQDRKSVVVLFGVRRN